LRRHFSIVYDAGDATVVVVGALGRSGAGVDAAG
jgi:hypothetical protein